MTKNQLFKVSLDHIGFSVSLLCAIHCGILPFLLALAPLANLEFLQDPWLENSIIAISLLIATLSLIHGYLRHHRKFSPFWIVLSGFAFIFLGHTFPNAWAEILFTALGATTVALAHLVNWKLARSSQTRNKQAV